MEQQELILPRVMAFNFDTAENISKHWLAAVKEESQKGVVIPLLLTEVPKKTKDPYAEYTRADRMMRQAEQVQDAYSKLLQSYFKDMVKALPDRRARYSTTWATAAKKKSTGLQHGHLSPITGCGMPHSQVSDLMRAAFAVLGTHFGIVALHPSSPYSYITSVELFKNGELLKPSKSDPGWTVEDVFKIENAALLEQRSHSHSYSY